MTDWEAVDWDMTDSEIARLVGVTRQRVHQVRHALGKPRSLSRSAVRRKVLAESGGIKTAKEWADEFNVSVSTIQKDLTLVGAEVKKPTPKPRKGRWVTDWDAVDWENKTVSQISRELGIAYPVVFRQKKRWSR
ncbi:MAG: hypothetical protein WC965_01550 [Thiohalomonadaceae bacterium]